MTLGRLFVLAKLTRRQLKKKTLQYFKKSFSEIGKPEPLKNTSVMVKKN
jgi:hypothetical protein